MKKARRVPKKIGADEDDRTHATAEQEEPTVVRKPQSNKVKKQTHLRQTFQADDIAGTDEGDETASKRRVNGLQKVQKDIAGRLPLRERLESDIPSYSAEYLADLKSSQRSAPARAVKDDHDSDDLDINSKFGAVQAAIVRQDDHTSRIPTEAEIREKKERRKRLKHEQDYISLNDGENMDIDPDEEDDEFKDPRQRSLILQADEMDKAHKYGESRLVHEDEDLAEGFDEFVEDSGRVTLGKKGAREQERQRRRDIEAQIREAQRSAFVGDSEDEVDEEEAARLAAYDSAQTAAGTFTSRSSRQVEKEREQRLRRKLERVPQPGPIPVMADLVAKWQAVLAESQLELDRAKQKAENLEQEREEIEKEEARLRTLLQEAAERYAKLRVESEAMDQSSNGGSERIERELETLDHMVPPEGEATAHETQLESMPLDSGDSTEAGFLGMPAQRSLGGMAALPHDDDDWY